MQHTCKHAHYQSHSRLLIAAAEHVESSATNNPKPAALVTHLPRVHTPSRPPESRKARLHSPPGPTAATWSGRGFEARGRTWNERPEVRISPNSSLGTHPLLTWNRALPDRSFAPSELRGHKFSASVLRKFLNPAGRNSQAIPCPYPI